MLDFKNKNKNKKFTNKFPKTIDFDDNVIRNASSIRFLFLFCGALYSSLHNETLQALHIFTLK